MKIQYCSDLHLEFPENNDYLIRHPLEVVGDILILAGDILPFAQLSQACHFLDWASANYKAVYWLPGNHEYYRSDMSERSLELNERIRPNVLIINNQVIKYEGINLVFTTLWGNISPDKAFQVQKSVSDFHLIRVNGQKLTSVQFSSLHAESLAFLKDSISSQGQDNTIIITHHVPTLLNYPQEYKNDPINEAFAVELYELIDDSKAVYWIFGHHHRNIPEFQIGRTRMMTNQLGYIQRMENVGFQANAVIEV